MSSHERQALRDFSLTFGSKIAAIVVAFVVQIILARALSPEGRGSYDACLILATSLLVVLNPGTEMATMYYVSSRRVEFSRGVSAGLLLTAVIACLSAATGALLVTLSPAFISGLLGKAARPEFLLALLTIPTTLVLQTMLSVITATKEFGFLSTLNVARRLGHLMLVLATVVVFGWGVAGALLAVLIE